MDDDVDDANSTKNTDISVPAKAKIPQVVTMPMPVPISAEPNTDIIDSESGQRVWYLNKKQNDSIN